MSHQALPPQPTGPITDTEVSAIYADLTVMVIQIADDPNETTSFYYTKAYGEIYGHIEKVNWYQARILRAKTEMDSKRSKLVLMRKTLQDDAVLLPAIAHLEIASAEKFVHATKKAEEVYAINHPGQPTLSSQIVELETDASTLQALLDCLREKRASLKTAEATLRTQERLWGDAIALQRQARQPRTRRPTLNEGEAQPNPLLGPARGTQTVSQSIPIPSPTRPPEQTG